MTVDLEQGSREWLLARVGKCTGSRVSDAVWMLKSGGPSANRTNYQAELVTERLTGEPYPQYQTDDMRWGTETEPQARKAYTFETGYEIEQVGFVPHPRTAMAGSSPDGRIVGKNGLVQFKCPKTATHIRTILTGKIDPDYMKQMQFEMACEGRDWCDYVSFDPRCSIPMRLYIVRVQRDEGMIAELEEGVSKFLQEVDEQVAKLVRRFDLKLAA